MNKDVYIGTIDNKNIYLMFCNDEVRKENQQLKELIKECSLLLRKQTSNDEVDFKESVMLVSKIEKVLE